MIELQLLKNKIPKKYPKLTTLFIIILIFITSTTIKTYDSYKTTVITQINKNKCILKTTMPYNKLNILDNARIKYNNKIYKINKVTYNDISNTNNIITQDISIYTDDICNKKIIDIKIINNKQRIINKIIKIIKEE